MKAQFALNLINDEFFMGEVEAIKKSYMDEIVNSNPENYDERENAYRGLLAVNKFVAHFESLAAQKQIDAKRRKIF